MASPLTVAVFFAEQPAGQHWSGTTATVFIADALPQPDTMVELAARQQSPASCWVWPENDHIQVRCFGTNGRPINFCGHGLLASAYAWSRHSDQDQGNLQTTAANYKFTWDQGQLWLDCPRLRCQPATELPAGLFHTPPVSSALCGNEQGYLILQWPDGFPLESLEPDFPAIAAATSRAIIATARTDESPDRVKLRYFAPQYGNNEDAVTGSACVVLADYWGLPELDCHQVSYSSGIVRTRLHNNTVSITGNLKVI